MIALNHRHACDVFSIFYARVFYAYENHAHDDHHGQNAGGDVDGGVSRNAYRTKGVGRNTQVLNTHRSGRNTYPNVFCVPKEQ